MLRSETIPELLAVREVAQILNVHGNTVRRWADQGIIEAYRITNRGDRRFNKEQIYRFLIELKNHSGDPEKASINI